MLPHTRKSARAHIRHTHARARTIARCQVVLLKGPRAASRRTCTPATGHSSSRGVSKTEGGSTETETQTERETERQTDTKRQTETETHRDRDRNRQPETDAEAEAERARAASGASHIFEAVV